MTRLSDHLVRLAASLAGVAAEARPIGPQDCVTVAGALERLAIDARGLEVALAGETCRAAIADALDLPMPPSIRFRTLDDVPSMMGTISRQLQRAADRGETIDPQMAGTIAVLARAVEDGIASLMATRRELLELNSVAEDIDPALARRAARPVTDPIAQPSRPIPVPVMGPNVLLFPVAARPVPCQPGPGGSAA